MRRCVLTAAATLAALSLASHLPAQQSWGRWTPGAAAFGHWTWGPPVADVASLPTCNADTNTQVRSVADAGSGDPGLFVCVSGTGWDLIASSGGGGGVSDHGALTGLADDDHTGYALLAGRTGGQTLFGDADDVLGLRLEAGPAANAANIFLAGSDGNDYGIYLTAGPTGSVVAQSGDGASFLGLSDGASNGLVRLQAGGLMRLYWNNTASKLDGELDGDLALTGGGSFVGSLVGNASTATTATTATTANAGDSATSFFSSGTLEDARLSANVSLLGQSISASEVAADVATQAELDAVAAAESDDQTAAQVPITDAGAYFTGTDVEAALQELGASGGGGGSSSGTGLQYGDGAGGFSEVTSSSVSGANVTLGGNLELAAGRELQLPLENSAATPTLNFGDGDTGIYESVDDTMVFVTAGLGRFGVVGFPGDPVAMLYGADNARSAALTGRGPSPTAPQIVVNRQDADSGFSSASVSGDDVRLIAGGSSVFGFARATALNTATVYGGLDLDSATGGTKPSCDSTKRGWLWFTEGGAGVADALEVCRKDAADAYAWTALY